MQESQQRRLVPKFDDDENKTLNHKIAKFLNTMTKQLKECENNIKNFAPENPEQKIQERIQTNMQQSLYNNFTEFTKKFKTNQEIYSNKFKKLFGEEDPTFDYDFNNDEKNNSNFLMTEDNTKVKRRDSELNKLVSTVNDLAQIFKDMKSLVMEQGSILDRIDYNIVEASDNVVEGKKSIKKAEKYQKKGCFRNGIIVLLIIIFLESIMVMFKFI